MVSRYSEEHEYVKVFGKKYKVIHPRNPSHKKRISYKRYGINFKLGGGI